MQATFEQALKYIKELPPNRTSIVMQPKQENLRLPMTISSSSMVCSSKPLKGKTKLKRQADLKLWKSINGMLGKNMGR